MVSGIDNFDSTNYGTELKYDRCEYLLKDIPVLKGDIRSQEKLRATIEGFQPDVIVHLGALAGVRQSLEMPKVYADNNILGTIAVFEVAKDLKIPVVYASSSSVYGNNKGIQKEDFDITYPESMYGFTKATNEMLANLYHANYGMKFIGLRFFTVIGEWGRPDMALWIFTDAIVKGKKLPLNNSGDMYRDFTYIGDIVDGLVSSILTVEVVEEPEVYNLGQGKTIKLLDFLTMIEKECKKKAIVENLPMQVGDVYSTHASIKKAHDVLGYTPQVTTKEAVRRFVKWYREHEQ
jgi:UDP-glucuronate 4-epimerase